MADKARFVIIGTGAAANAHAQAICSLKDAELVGVYGIEPQATVEFAEKNGGVKIYSDLEEIYADKSVDTVSICTPSGFHASQTVDALNNGKNVVVEKPMALNGKDCDAIIAAEKKSGKFCAVISQLRFSEGLLAVKEAINKNALGKLVSGNLNMKYYRSKEYYANSNWKGKWAMDGGGALMNQGIHGIDILLYLMGEAASVSGIYKTLVHNIEVEDTAGAIIEFKNGAIGLIEGTTSVSPGFPRIIEISGSDGRIVLEENNIKSWDIALPIPKTEKTLSSSHNNPLAMPGHVKQYVNIVNTIIGKDELGYKSTDAANTVKLICAIYESSRKGEKIFL